MARAKKAEAQAVLDFVKAKILAAARPEGVEGGLGPEVTLRKALEAALPQVESTVRGQPVVEALVRSTLGVSFSYLGDPKTAANQCEIARERLITQLGRDDPATLGSSNNLAIKYWDQGRYADAVKLHEETLALQRAKQGPDHPDTLWSIGTVAGSLIDLDRPSEALPRISRDLLTWSAADALRAAMEATALGNRLFHDRRGPIEIYPSRDYDYKQDRTSWSPDAKDPDHPALLVLQLEATLAGCRWMLERWGELRGMLESGMGWQSHEKIKVIRLMGKQPVNAVGVREVAQVFLACHALEPQFPYAFQELRCEIHEDRFKIHKVLLNLVLPHFEPGPNSGR